MARKKISRILKDAGIYDPKLEPQIRLTERLEFLVDRLTNELGTAELLDVEINASGTEKKVVNPIVDKLLSLEKQLQSSYTALGLNYNVKPDNYKQARADEDKDNNNIQALFDI